MKLTHASTFSGIGAPEIAAEMLGWDNLFHVEINPFGRQILEYYFPNSKSYEDITKSDFSEWRGKVDVLTGGFPCQPFSYAGKRRGSEDDRYLWPFMLKCIEQVQPRWFVGENVGGITTMVFPRKDVEVGEQASLFGEGDKIYEKRERYVIDEICESLERAGYSVQPMLIPACAVGAPHRRDRVFIVACRKGEPMARTSADASCSGSGAQAESDRLISEWRDRLSLASQRGDSSQRIDGLSALQGHSSDTESEQGAGHQSKQPEFRRSQSCQFGGGDCKGSDLLPENRWRTFPSVSPVYRGNDGLQPLLDYIAVHEERNSMDRDSVIAGALASGKIEVDFVSGKIYSTRIRGHEGERIELKGADCSGYIVHTLSFNGVKKQCRAHQIVWIAANGTYDKNKFQIDHINRDRKDNRIDNLRLVTAKENIANSEHKIQERIFTPEEEQHIQELFYQGNMSIRELAQDFGCSKSHIFNVVHRFPNLQIPFNEWKRESLKAYGNAIVPQVMYEIFRGIDEIESNNRNIQTFKK